ncbi:MAG: hypothetical protein DDT22_00953 [candidate division WS2 bacterium]|nr:hypothetical protein [Candidatus Lithacetigena glycinireducens]
MTNRKKEFAKFFAGVAAEETTIHWALGLSGILPLNFFGFNLTQIFNTILMVFWPIVAILLVYYARIKK